MMKMGFSTGSIDGWPPFEVEHIWLDRAGDDFIVLNTPFYVRGISYGDRIAVECDDGEYIEKWSMVAASGNSTIWVMELKPDSFRRHIGQITRNGIDVSAGIPSGYYSVNVPPNIAIDVFDNVVRGEMGRGELSVAYPTIRQ